MDEREHTPWQGGPWERGEHLPPPPRVDIPRPLPPVLRPKRRSRRLHWAPPLHWPLFLGLFLLCCLGVLLQWRGVHIPGFSGDVPEPPSIEEPYQPEQLNTTPPHIPQAPTDTGVTVEFAPAQGEPLSYREIYDTAHPCMVSIGCLKNGVAHSGTGIILTDDGHILTNAHVVANGREVMVYLHDNRAFPAALVGFAPEEDLAVLKVEAEGLTPAVFGDSHLLHIGDPVAALGDSLGYRSTLSSGIVSALDRELELFGDPMVLIQTNAAINSGNSGGALLNEYGQVVGVTSVKIVARDGSAEAVGFAIPSRRVRYVVNTLMAGEPVRSGFFGLTVLTAGMEGGGLEILEVAPWSDGASRGLQAGDVILSADGLPVNDVTDLARVRLDRGPGDPVELVCRRGDREFSLTLLLADRPR